MDTALLREGCCTRMLLALLLLGFSAITQIGGETVAERMRRVRAEQAAGSHNPGSNAPDKAPSIVDAIKANDVEVSFHRSCVFLPLQWLQIHHIGVAVRQYAG